MTFNEVKRAYIDTYGDIVFNSRFNSFDEAFRSAWDSFDFIQGASNASEYAEGMCNCWELTDGH